MEVLPDIVASGAGRRLLRAGRRGEPSCETTTTRRRATPSGSRCTSAACPPAAASDGDALVAGLSLGLTDLVGHRDPHWVEIDALVEKLERWRPDWVAFTSKTVAHGPPAPSASADRASGRPTGTLGPAQVFVLPGVSGANQPRTTTDADAASWWRDLAALAS